uniref:Uncharacterized protein n=1 Tax=Trichogramma kaykai TaxID=54128 RepID=A0ABD2VYY0_9HYME
MRRSLRQSKFTGVEFDFRERSSQLLFHSMLFPESYIYGGTADCKHYVLSERDSETRESRGSASFATYESELVLSGKRVQERPDDPKLRARLERRCNGERPHANVEKNYFKTKASISAFGNIGG